MNANIYAGSMYLSCGSTDEHAGGHTDGQFAANLRGKMCEVIPSPLVNYRDTEWYKVWQFSKYITWTTIFDRGF